MQRNTMRSRCTSGAPELRRHHAATSLQMMSCSPFSYRDRHPQAALPGSDQMFKLNAVIAAWAKLEPMKRGALRNTGYGR
jgi:hypothetical protein